MNEQARKGTQMKKVGQTDASRVLSVQGPEAEADNQEMEATLVTAEQKEIVEEQQLRRRARWLLKNFRKFLDKKHKQEEEMRNTPLYTRDDALYLLSGMAGHKSSERVQTSNISNAPEKAAINVDETLERMNKEVLAEVSKGYNELCERITLVNIALQFMKGEVQNVARQVYVKGTPIGKVIGVDGTKLGRTRAFELLNEAVKELAKVLSDEREIVKQCEADKEVYSGC